MGHELPSGSSDLLVGHRQGLGCMRFGNGTPADADRDPAAVIGAALDAGIGLLDTADVYGTEEVVGRAIRGRREEVLLCTKFGLVFHPDGNWSVRADAGYVRSACEASLTRLGVDTVDLLYLHHRSSETPIEETVAAMAGLVDSGAVRFLGLSNVTEDDLRRAHAVHPIAAVQEEWSLVQRGVERLLPALVELGVPVVAHSPTGHGLLQATGEDDPALGELRAALTEVAAGHGAEPGQVALAWVHARRQRWGLPVVPLPGTTRVSHLLANVAAADLALSAAELERLDALSAAVR